MQTSVEQTQFTAPILVIDTSSSQGAVALFDGLKLSTRSWPADRAHTSTLLCEVHHLLDTAGQDIMSVAAIVVATGPGTFTGLRAGFGLAKGFHLATDAPLIGVPTLLATAFPFASCAQPILATVAAGRGRLVWSAFHQHDDGLRESAPPRNDAVAEFTTAVATAGRCVVTGDIDEATARQLADLREVVVPPPAVRMRQPAALATLGWMRWQSGETDDPATLEPVYLSR